MIYFIVILAVGAYMCLCHSELLTNHLYHLWLDLKNGNY